MQEKLNMPQKTKSGQRVLILGIGNLLWGDEGFGVRAVQHLERHYRFSDNVRLLDGGTQGIYLVQEIRETDILVVFDAVDYGLPGGTLKNVKGDQVPKFLGCKKVSLHQTGFQEVLAMADMLGDYPEHLLLIGVQPVELEDYGGSLRPEVRNQIEPAIETALQYLAGFGIKGQRLSRPRSRETSLDAAIADMDRYEIERPPEDVAYRSGDTRVLLSDAFKVKYRPVPVEGIRVPIDQHLDKYRSEEG